MSKAERQAYDEHLSAIMIQNDVLDGAKLEGRMEGQMEGRAEGRAEGRVEGRVEGLQEVARNMKKLGFSTDIIIQSTQLSEKEIENL